MISAQNHQQQLNGSKLLGLLFFFLLLAASCDSLKKAQGTSNSGSSGKDNSELEEIQGKKVYNPKTGKFEEVSVVSGTMDTVEWTEVPVEEQPPITSDGSTIDPGTRTGGDIPDPGGMRSSYNVALLLPFLGNKFREYENSIDEKSDLALNYYSGAKLAFEDLSQKGIQLNVSVFDTEASESKTRALLNRPELMSANMIVGPVRRNNLKLAANFAKQNKKVLVSPLSPSTAVTSNNPYYVQVSPSLQSHCEAITRHALDNHAAENVILVCRNKNAEVSRLKYFQEANVAINGSNSVDRLTEFIIPDQSVDLNETDLTPYIKDGKTTVFIVPSWSNQSFIYSLLRKISVAKRQNKVVVYGMPQWMKFERAGLDYFESLNVHVSSANSIDMDDPNVLSFRQRFFDRYGMLPSVDAYVGYDVMMYFGQMIDKHGTAFNQAIDREPKHNLHTYFDFEPVAPKSANVENYSAIERYENTRVNILMFKDYYFQVAN